jgi:stearoyl-CoA desaturase (delta-9 desaturase)
MINLCSRVGLASNLTRVPDFKIQRAILDTQFQAARHKLEETPISESLRATLEREYQLFTTFINQWSALQSERYERRKEQLGDALEARRQQLQEQWENAALRTKLRALEYSLKMQRKRLGLLMRQIQFQAQAV